MGAIRTFTGLWVDPRAISKEEVSVRDIAHALSLQCRFSGYSRIHYSVASHSLYVAQEVARAYGCPLLTLFGLLHDASEAYLVDIPKPLKNSPPFSAYLGLEEAVQRTIEEALVGWEMNHAQHVSIKEIDSQMCEEEMRQLFGPVRRMPGVIPILRREPEVVERVFLDRYRELKGIFLRMAA